jgi:hypothetical protein
MFIVGSFPPNNLEPLVNTMAANLFLSAYLSLPAMLLVLIALTLVILVHDLLNHDEPGLAPSLPQYTRRMVNHLTLVAHRLYWRRDRLLISIPRGALVHTSYYIEEAPGIFVSNDQTGTLVLALPGVIWVRYTESGYSRIVMHGLLSTQVSIAHSPLPWETIYSSIHQNTFSEMRSSQDTFAHTSLNITPPNSPSNVIWEVPFNDTEAVSSLSDHVFSSNHI